MPSTLELGFVQTELPLDLPPAPSDAENMETSGGTRFSKGKPGMWWAIPLAGLRLVSEVTMYGAKKYAPLDWAEGQSFSTLFDCTMRHLERMATDGLWSRDKESGLLHAAHAAWNLLCLLHFMQEGREDLDDVSKYRGMTTAEYRRVEGSNS